MEPSASGFPVASAAASQSAQPSQPSQPSQSFRPTITAQPTQYPRIINYPTITPKFALDPAFEVSAEPEAPVPVETPSLDGLPGLPLATISPNETVGVNAAGVCFPSTATVELQSGLTKRMSEVSIGDVVAVGNGIYSPVFMFTHKTASYYGEFMRFMLENGRQITLTESHYIYLSGVLRPAGSVRVGDTVQLADGSVSRVNGVSIVMDSGLYNPQTAHGDILVNGVRASTFTTAVQPGFAQAALSPLRMVFSNLGISTGLFNSGADALVKVAPKGNMV